MTKPLPTQADNLVKELLKLHKNAVELSHIIGEQEKFTRENEEQIRAVLNSIGNLLWILDEDGSIKWANKAVYDRLGYSESDLLGQSILSVHPPESHEEAKQILDDVLVGKSEKCSLPMLCKDGTQIPGISCAVAGKWNGHNIIVEVADDLSAFAASEKKYKKALQESEERLELFFAQSLDGFFFMMLDEPIQWDDTVDKEKVLDYVFNHQRMTKANQAMLSQYNSPAELMIGLTPNDLFAHDIEGGRQAWKKLFDQGHLHLYTHERKFDGTPMWVEGDYVCMHDSEGHIIGHFGIQRDITARKQMEEALRINEARFRSLFNQTHDGVFLLDFNGKHIAYNHRAAKMLGYTMEELQELSVANTSAEVDKSMNVIDRLVAGEHVPTYERNFRKKDGTIFPVEINIEVVYDSEGSMTHLQSVVRDITERKQAEAALRESETRLTALFENARDAIMIVDPASGLLADVNSQAEVLTGFPKDQLIGRQALLLYPEDQIRKHASFFLEHSMGGPRLIETEIINADGVRVPVEVSASMIKLPNGKVVLQGFFRDISARKRAEKNMRDLEARWQFAVEGAGDGVWDYNLQTNRTFYSKTWKEQLGYNEADIGTSVEEWIARIHPEDAAVVQADMNKYMNGQSPIYVTEYRMQCKNGDYKWIMARGKIIQYDTDGNPIRIIGTHTDITERKRGEQQIQLHLKEIESLQAELRDQAIHDPLTGLFNRRYMQDVLRREFSRAAREGSTLSLIMIDMDELKKINDSYGHHNGDMAIQLLARKLSTSLRLEDIVCRYGGDEFVILMSGITSENVAQRIDEWHTSLSENQLDVHGSKIHIKFTAGVASFPSDGTSIDEVINFADVALYRGKAHGGNCTVIYKKPEERSQTG